MLQVGSLVDNKYKILSEVGHGGMSVVYLAINERANKTWAVKEIRKDGVCDFEAVRQGLVVETDMLKKLNHDHLPSIIDVIDSQDSFLIVMDYIEGKSLQSVLKSSGAQPQDLVIKWGIQLCDVLGYLHGRDPAIIYRDMKPANVMLKPNGDITLIDFGTAREFKNRTMVEDTTCLGTRGYAAPEQFGGRGQTDARTDIYCLGATLYHLLTGHSPAEPPYEIKPLSYWDPKYAGSGLEYIINKCCQQDPMHRYQSCAELMYDLEHVSDMDYTTLRARRNKWAAFVGSVAMLLVGIVGMVGFSLAKSDATTQTYDYYIEEAEALTSAAEFPQFVDYIEDAIAVDPGRYEAYDALLSRVEEDGRMDMQTEYDPINRCLHGVSEGFKNNNETYLLDENMEGYADIQFRVGKLLFLMSTGEEENLRQSATYFKRALTTGGMEQSTDPDIQKKAILAKSLQIIGEHIGALDTQTQMFQEGEYSYSALWQDLQELIQNNSIESMGSRAYGIALYSRVAAMVVSNYKNFASEGITAAEMIALLDQIEEALVQTKESLQTAEINRGFGTLIDGALQNIDTAKNMIDGLKGGAE